ncbi:M15 family metallopeptidase [Porphyromonas macacae]|nr:M15 family metallopeptidase [Porphyromonas macacae]
MGLIDIQESDSTIHVRLMYGTNDNFMGKNLYGCLQKAFFEKNFAHKIIRAQQELKKLKPGYSLLIHDAARPISVQREMYSQVNGTPYQMYVANGKRGGRHNYGVAADVSIIDDKGNQLDMGCPVDYFGIKAHTGNETEMVRKGLITPEARENRELLRQVMKKAGLRPYHREWWHYQETIDMPSVRKRYRLLNF